MNRLIICFASIALTSFTLLGSDNEIEKTKISLGLFGGLAQYGTISGDIFGGVLFPVSLNKVDVNMGYNRFSSQTDYKNVSALEYNSHGIFLSGNIVFPSNVYLGLKLGYNLNWVSDDSQKKFDRINNVDAPEFFLGKSGLWQIGYRLSLGKAFEMKFQGQLGIHNFKMAEGIYWQIGSGSNRPSQEIDAGIETKLHLLYNLGVGLIYDFN